MKNLADLLKTTAVGGLVFLVPLVVVGLILLKALQVMRLLAQPLAQWIPSDTPGGVLVGNLLLFGALFLVCLLAGLAARSARGKKLGATLESSLLSMIPGYAFVKGFTDSMASSDEVAGSFTPVIARFDDNAQIAFEVERTDSGQVVLYLPGAPNPWAGTVVYMPAERVEPLEMSMPEAIKNIRQLGRGSAAFHPAAT